MVKKRPSSKKAKPLANQRRGATSIAELFSGANQRAHEQANRRGGKRALKSVRAAIAATDLDGGEACHEATDWPQRLIRWALALALLPFCWVTTWTFLARFSQATVYQGFWQTAEFWYFATGGLLMVGWFLSGLFQPFFLYLYVLGHELTHAVFVLIYRGKVTDFYVSTEGGYITTNKTNLVIALSPYFVPFWSVIAAGLYAAARYFWQYPPEWDRTLYAVMGVTWTFHMVWTLWMIPRDQPDLKENGTFLSLVIIYLANLVVLAGLLCVADESPWKNSREFGMDWFRNAATSIDVVLRWGNQCVVNFREAGRF